MNKKCTKTGGKNYAKAINRSKVQQNGIDEPKKKDQNINYRNNSKLLRTEDESLKQRSRGKPSKKCIANKPSEKQQLAGGNNCKI